MIRVKVTATTANIGPGFDSLGIASQLYNIIEEKNNSGHDTYIPNKDQEYIETDKQRCKGLFFNWC